MYKIRGINSLYYADMNDRKYYFMRDIEEKDKYFLAPEIIEACELKKRNIVIHPIFSEIYSAAALVLYMMTLGESEKTVKEKQMSIQEYLDKNFMKLSKNYPVMATVINTIF